MNRTWVLRAALTIAAVVGLLPLFLPNFFSTFSTRLEPVAGVGYVVREIPGMPLPDGLRQGDVIALDRMEPAARSAILVVDNPVAGSTIQLVVRREAETISLPVTAVIDHSIAANANRLANYPLMLGILALALVTLWLGRDWTAWGLSMFSLSLCVRLLVSQWPATGMPGFASQIAARLMMWLIVNPGLYIATESLVGAGLSMATKRRFRIAFAILLALTMTASLGRSMQILLHGWIGWMGYKALWDALGIAVFMLPLLLLVAGYRRSDAAHRLRIRWVLWSTGLLGATLVLEAAIPETSIYPRLAVNVLQSLSFFGYLYAVLRHRLVDVSFFVDRALAYGVTTSLVVGVFAIIENFIEQAAVGNDASFLLQAGATLVLALLLNRVHRYVENLVDRVFFRRQRRATQELRCFAKQCAFIEQHDRLISLTAERIEAAVGGSGVAIYERREARYVRLVRRGSIDCPETIEVDDLAFVSLRANLHPIDLDSIVGSALGTGGSVFPMALRGLMIGAVVCGARNGEQFAPDEREELAKLAQEVGIALYVLRARGHERFVAAVAAGGMGDPQAAARQMMPSLTAYGADPGI